MNFSSLKVKTKLWAGFGVMAVIVIAVSGAALHWLDQSSSRVENYLHGVAARERLVIAVQSAAKSRAIAARNLVLVTTPQDRAMELDAVTKSHEEVKQSLAKLKEHLAGAKDATSQDKAMFDKLAGIEDQYGKVALAIVGLANDGKRDDAIAKMNAECRPLLAALLGATGEFIRYEDERSAAETQAASELFATDRSLLLATAVFSAAIAGLLGWLISRAVTAPLNRAIRVAQSVADGDLREEIEVDGRDELSQLLTALKAMSGNLSSMVSNVRQAADGIATASTQIASGNQDLSSRTESQASALQQTASSMAQMTETVQVNAESSRKATGLADAAAQVAGQGGEVVHRVISTMEAITGSSKRIGDIIGVIDGIAFQTNILALNAAVEAARAGEQGRGFAVVASEVRALAQRSAQAAKEIKTLISDSVANVDAGGALVQEAGRTMDAVMTQVRKVTDLMGEINASTEQQSHGIVQVNEAVAAIDRGTQQNAALVEESAAAAESLRQQAMALSEAIARFKVRGAAVA
ncbi:methyl-accepting chemotaxis protein [Mitsuaria sp. GD03876]|uniref:methyl-accepting chemotaxis protein n=1 Tax=Mitsuaria sp. GD03876 TaxID=2975399 RepID=UPI002447D859|nr:methyl-accepting chemotaxis protein [Mitsuaria sp. GD03876]MDH0867581.1 methyl-accepting chemotaxis protein [Mitsuaria sp. GD03876]